MRTTSATFWASAGFLALLLLLGCDPTDPDDPADVNDNRPELTVAPAVLMPAGAPQRPTEAQDEAPLIPPTVARAKPGHWVGVSATMQSNRADRRGELRLQASVATSSPGDLTFVENGDVVATPTGLSNQAAGLAVVRPVVLPRNQRRRLDARILLPTGRVSASPLRIDSSYQDAGSAFSIRGPAASIAPMAAQTYHLVVLTQRPERFAPLVQSDWVSPPRGPAQFSAAAANYDVVIPGGGGVLPIGESALEWTSTAVLWWHDLPPEAITAGQWTAIDDWLHFGGRLVVDGPSAAAAIAASDHADWLPIGDRSNVELDPAMAADWAASLSVPGDESLAAVRGRLADGTVRVAVGEAAASTADWLGDGSMVARHRVGRGTVVQSRFDLLSDWTADWHSFDSFINGAVLSRPPRNHEIIREDPQSPQTYEIRQNYVIGDPNAPRSIANALPSWNTDLRWLSRDASLAAPTGEARVPNESTLWANSAGGLGTFSASSPAVATAAGQLLGDVGVSIPDRRLLVRSLMIYLTCLIPINYVVFRVLDRLQWAWIAIVPIAIGGAIFMTRRAAVDVGLVRTRHEWSLLELPPGHDRGHLTRVVGLYNSLASSYTLTGPDADVVIDPLAATSTNRDDDLFGPSRPSLRLSRSGGVSLTGLTVPSNAYRAVHVEQLVEAGGPVRWQTDRSKDPLAGGELINQTEWSLSDAWVVRRDPNGQFDIAVVGGLLPTQRRTIRWDADPSARIPEGLSAIQTDWLSRLTNPANVLPGQTMLVGRIEGPLGGLSIEPAETDARATTLVVCHLTAPPPRPPSIDRSLPPRPAGAAAQDWPDDPPDSPPGDTP